MIVDQDKVASIIEEIAGAEILSRFGKLEKSDIDTKAGPNDFVTEADRAAEAALRRALCDFYPGAGFIGEEGAAADPSILTVLEGEGAFWIVDPLDGTRNFIEKVPEFGTIVALVVDGVTQAGWIYAAPDKKFAIGMRGDGASWDGELLPPFSALPEALHGYRAIGNLAEPWKSTLIPNLKAQFITQPTRCSAYAYIKMIRGREHFGVYSRCSPWDHAAGVLMLNEIGGRATYLDDDAPYRPVATQGRPLLAAANSVIFTEIAETIAPSVSVNK